MNTGQLECFLAVADTLSFARAAERLHVTQPAVTHQIRTLEAELGTTLFNRTTRRVALTEDGQIFLPDAESILGTSRRAIARYRTSERIETLPLRVGNRGFLHAAALGNVFGRMSATHPELRPDMVIVTTDNLYRQLEDGDLHVALDLESNGYPGTTFHRLLSIPLVCVCRKDSVLAQREAVTLAELQGQRLAVSPPTRVPPQLRKIYRDLIGEGPLDNHYVCSSRESALVAVQAGLAIGIHFMDEPPLELDLACVPIAGEKPLGFGAYVRKGETNPLVRNFLKIAREEFANERR